MQDILCTTWSMASMKFGHEPSQLKYLNPYCIREPLVTPTAIHHVSPAQIEPQGMRWPNLDGESVYLKHVYARIGKSDMCLHHKPAGMDHVIWLYTTMGYGLVLEAAKEHPSI
jgi:hypothetical protein